MKLIIILAAVFAATTLAMTPAQADPKPSGAKPPDAQVLANLYAGRTQLWRSCKAGIYFGAKWEAQAYCEKSGKSVAIGKWSVSRDGKLCHDMTWYWKEGDGYGSKKDGGCVRHLVDADGTMWRKWDSDPEWWRFNEERTPKGFKYKNKVNRLRKQLKI